MLNVNVAILESLNRQFPSPSRFLIAVSGGRDSQVLLSAFSHVSRSLGHQVLAVGVNHGLRAEADAELDLAEALANKVGVPFERVHIKVKKGGNLLARARDGRYDVLNDKKKEHGCHAIVTAHHMDDVAETVIFRILRSSRLGSFSVMPELTTNGIFRPLLKINRDQITKYSRNRHIHYADDPSNANTDFDRIWIRKEVIPLLEERFPGFSRRMAFLSEEVRSLLENKLNT